MTMRKSLFVAAIAVLGTSAHAEPGRDLVASTAPPATQAATASTAQPSAPQPSIPAPAKSDKSQMIIEQLIKHGVIKPPPAQTSSAAAPPTNAAASAPPAQAAPLAPAPSAAVTPAPGTRAGEQATKMNSTESRIRAELRRHGIR
jgi:hypothetical protein